ncbi:MAG: GIY-YIG nuclease family protein [Propionibacterium sp.]|nr:GIY-YIG nuclease family protein [Propionibacterium sp.]
MAYVYMLRCSDGSYYVGSTVNLHQRFEQHMTGKGAIYTRRRRPVELVFAAEFESPADAFAMEKQVQGWSRAKREALIVGDFNEISRLARNSRNRAVD